MSISRNFLQTPASDDVLARNFTRSKLIILVEDLVSWKRGFKICLIKHDTGDIENKNIAGGISVTHPIICGSVHTGCYTYNSLVHIISVLFICNRIIIYLLFIWIEACLKLTIFILLILLNTYLFLFLLFEKLFKYFKDIFNSISIYSWKRISFPINIENVSFKSLSFSIWSQVLF